MKSHQCALIAIATMLMGLSSPITFAQDTYRLIPVGPMGEAVPGAIPSGLNNKGQVIGQMTDIDTNERVPFLWRGRRMVGLGSLGGDPPFAEARGINDRSEVVGLALSTAGTITGFVWQHGEMTDLPDLSGTFTWSWAYDINNRREIVGEACSATDRCVPVMWREGSIVELAPVNGTAFAVNELGHAAGVTGSQAFLWNGVELQSLGTLPGSSASIGLGINNLSDVVGESRSELGSRAFLWREGSMQALDFVQARDDSSYARSINDARQIVGQSGALELVDFKATLWQGGRAFYLDDLIDPRDPLYGQVTLVEAISINDRGQIVAWGYTPGSFAGFGYLLDPVRARD